MFRYIKYSRTESGLQGHKGQSGPVLVTMPEWAFRAVLRLVYMKKIYMIG